MESNILTAIFLPFALGIIMLGMGLSLTLKDFQRVTFYPKAVIIGLVNQLLVLPLIAFSTLLFLPVSPELAVGVMILAACPGGATSNLLTHMAKGDTALSISLTAISSFITVFSIPILVNFSLIHFMGEGEIIQLPVLKTMAQIVVITIIPVSIGMILKNKFPELAKKSEKPVKISSAIFITIIIIGAILNDKDVIIPSFIAVGPVTLLLNVVMLAIAYFSAKLFNASKPQSISISIESGIQNGTLAIAIASSPLLLNNPDMAISPAIYSLIMFITAFAAVSIFTRKKFIEAD
jgi:bile acid:Na+ symporter, BASS family